MWQDSFVQDVFPMLCGEREVPSVCRGGGSSKEEEEKRSCGCVQETLSDQKCCRTNQSQSQSKDEEV